MGFKEFYNTLTNGMDAEIIKLSPNGKLTDLDIAIQYAVGKEMEKKGVSSLEVTEEEIFHLIGKHCGIGVRNIIFDNLERGAENG